jgi:hypothetical protein
MALSPISTEPNTPNTNDATHIPCIFAPSYNNVPSSANAPGGHGITRQYALFLDFDNKADTEECELTVQKLLESLHIRHPAIDYLQFGESLQVLGINYLAIAAVLDADFYMHKVGMSRAAAHIFYDGVLTELRGGVDQQRVRKRGLRVNTVE